MGTIKHAKTSAIPAPLDNSRINGPDWNQPHEFDLAISDIDGLTEALIPVEQVEGYRDQALAAAVSAGESKIAAEAFAADAAASAEAAAEALVDLSAPDGAELVGTPTGTVQAALDARPTEVELATDGAALIGTQPAAAGSYSRTQKEVNEDWIDVLSFIPAAQRAAIFDGTTVYDATTGLVAAAVVAIATGKGLHGPYWGKLFCAANADISGVKNIDMPGPIQMGTAGVPATLTVGGGANSSSWCLRFGDVTNGTSVLVTAPPAVPVLRIAGLKRSQVVVGSCNYLQLWADAAVSAKNSTAYNQIFLNGAQSKVELTDAGGVSWINENTFHGGGIQRLSIIGVGYTHNHNKFNRPVFEGASVALVYTNCSENLIEDGRFENVSGSLGRTYAANTYRNDIIVSWSGVGSPRGAYVVPAMPVTDLGMDNNITTRALMTHRKNRLFSVNGQSLIVGNATASASNERAINAARFNNFIRAVITPSIKGFTSGANRLIAVSDRIPVVNGDTVVFDGDFDGSLARALVYVYDADMNLLTTEGGGGVYFNAPSFTYTGANGSYGHGADVSAAVFNGLAGSVVRSEVKYIRVLVYSATGGFFRSLGASVYSRHLLQPSGQEGAASMRPMPLSLAGVPTNGFAPESTPIYDSTARRYGVNVFSWETQLTGALAAGATSATVVNALTAANADIVGILLTDGTTHWTTVSALAGATFTIAAIPVGKAALAGAPVVFNRWAYGDVGYFAGSGGSVVQATSKATTVTLNKPSGQIVMNTAELAGGAVVAFALLNNTIGANDIVLVKRASGGTDLAYFVDVDKVGAGFCNIYLQNVTGGALTEVVTLTFVVIKAAIT